MQENRIRKAHSSEAPFHRERCTAHYDMDSTHAARANMHERAMQDALCIACDSRIKVQYIFREIETVAN